MSFFNKKEEVIDLKLTRFGRGELSRGRFEPVYYQFFDDDIIYDVSWTGMSEEQNDSEPRIKEAARLKTQHLAVGVETNFHHQTRLIENEERGKYLDIKRTINQTEEEKILKYALGKYSPGAEHAPSYKIDFLDAMITGSVQYTTSSRVLRKTPILTIEPEYIYTIDRPIEPNTNVVLDSEAFVDFTAELIEFPDGSTVDLTKKDFIIDLEEYSSFMASENFEIEFYKETETGSDKYVKIEERQDILKFFKITTDEQVNKNSIKGRA